MGKPTIRSSLPPIYANLLSPIFDAPKVEEPRATCDACQMCDQGGDKGAPGDTSTVYFHPDTKCCTFYPSLPNYLLGAILSDPRPEMEEGKRRIREKIRAKVGVLPQRLAPPKKWSVVYAAAMESSFGRSALLKCPYLGDDSRCTIWHHRESVCLSFFCKFELGSYGSELWNEMKAYLATAEKLLSTWVAKDLWPEVKDFRPGPSSTLTLEELEERPDATYAAAWGDWQGREEEFYVACHDRVKAMSRDEYAKVVDNAASGRKQLAKLGTVIENLRAARQVPGRIALNKKLTVLPTDSGVVLTMPYNAHDSIKIENDLYEVLQMFSYDRTVGETRDFLEKEHGIELADELLSMFTMHEIMVGPPAGGLCDSASPPMLLGARCAAPPKK